MQLEIFNNNVTEVSVTKLSTDFTSSSFPSKSVSIFSLPANCSVLGVSVDIDENFIGVDTNEYLVSMTNSFISKKNLTNLKSKNYNFRDFSVDPYISINRSWSTGGNLSVAVGYLAGLGTQDAGLSFGGITTGSVLTSAAEEYNGTSWSSAASISSARRHLAGAGSLSAGLTFGGTTGTAVATTEHFNGTSWTAGGSLNTADSTIGGCGTESAGLCFGGQSGSATTEEYDGTSWAAGGTLNTGRSSLTGCGTQTAGLSFGGWTVSALNVTEEYNGATWTSANNLNNVGYYQESCGIQNGAVCIAGSNASSVATSNTEEYDGTSWSYGNETLQARISPGGCGNSKSTGLTFGGQNSVYLATTEEYSYSSTTPIYATVESQGLAGWTSGVNYPIVLAYSSAIGESNSACMNVCGENLSTFYSNCYEFDGVTWNAGGSVSLGVRSFATAGTVLAGLKFGGTQGTPQAVTEEYNGTSWSAGGSLSQARQNLGGCGTQTTGLCIGGYYATSATYLDSTEEYNGATWSAGGDLAYGINSLHVAGTQTAAIESGGYNPTLGLTTFSSEYDGSVWTIASEMISAITSGASFGSQTSSVIFGGTALSGVTSNTFIYDGINWSTSKDTITPTKLLAGTGNSGGTNGIKICGRYSDNTYTPSVEYFDMHSSDNLDLTGGSLTFNIAYINYNNS